MDLDHIFCCRSDGDTALCGADLRGLAEASSPDDVEYLCVACDEAMPDTNPPTCPFGGRCPEQEDT